MSILTQVCLRRPLPSTHQSLRSLQRTCLHGAALPMRWLCCSTPHATPVVHHRRPGPCLLRALSAHLHPRRLILGLGLSHRSRCDSDGCARCCRSRTRTAPTGILLCMQPCGEAMKPRLAASCAWRRHARQTRTASGPGIQLQLQLLPLRTSQTDKESPLCSWSPQQRSAARMTQASARRVSKCGRC